MRAVLDTWSLVATVGVGILAVFVGLLVSASARRGLARAGTRLQRRLYEEVRPRLVEIAAEGTIGQDIVKARGRRARVIDRLAIQQLPKVKGESRQHLAELLEQRQAVRSARRWIGRRRASGRTRLAILLGGVARTDSERVLGSLLLLDRRGGVRATAARALGRLGDPRAAALLILALEHDVISTGIAAAGLLDLGRDVIEPLRVCLERRDARTRAVAAELLGILHAASAAAELQHALGDSSTSVRVAAARALGRVGGPAAVEALRRCLGPGERVDLLAVAAEAIGTLGALDAIDDLLRLATDSRHVVARAAAAALATCNADGRGALEEMVARGRAGHEHARQAIALAHLRGEHASTYVSWSPPLPAEPEYLNWLCPVAA